MPNPGRDEVLLQLETVCRSEVFDGLKRSQALLRYLIEASLDDRKPNEVQIAVEFFKKDPHTYHPKLDPLVRVSVAKVRARLAEYYSTYGTQDIITIQIPRGTYLADVHLNPQHGANAKIKPLKLSDAWWAFYHAERRFKDTLATLGFHSANDVGIDPDWIVAYQGLWEFGIWDALQFFGVHPSARLSEEVQLYIKEEGFSRTVLHHDDGIQTYYYLPSQGVRIKELSSFHIIANSHPSPDAPGIDAYRILFNGRLVEYDKNL